MSPARPLMIVLFASVSLALAAPALAHGTEQAASGHSWGWLGSAANYVASCFPGGGSTPSKDTAAHGSTWWTSGRSESPAQATTNEIGIWTSLTGHLTGSHDADDNSGDGSIGQSTGNRYADDKAGPSPSGGSTGTGATGSNGTSVAAGGGENGGFGESLGSGNTGSTGTGSTDTGTTDTGTTGNTTAGSSAPGARAGSSTDVPEPGMLGLFGAGLVPLALHRRARRKAAA